LDWIKKPIEVIKRIITPTPAPAPTSKPAPAPAPTPAPSLPPSLTTPYTPPKSSWTVAPSPPPVVVSPTPTSTQAPAPAPTPAPVYTPPTGGTVSPAPPPVIVSQPISQELLKPTPPSSSVAVPIQEKANEIGKTVVVENVELPPISEPPKALVDQTRPITSSISYSTSPTSVTQATQPQSSISALKKIPPTISDIATKVSQGVASVIAPPKMEELSFKEKRDLEIMRENALINLKLENELKNIRDSYQEKINNAKTQNEIDMLISEYNQKSEKKIKDYEDVANQKIKQIYEKYEKKEKSEGKTRQYIATGVRAGLYSVPYFGTTLFASDITVSAQESKDVKSFIKENLPSLVIGAVAGAGISKIKSLIESKKIENALRESNIITKSKGLLKKEKIGLMNIDEFEKLKLKGILEKGQKIEVHEVKLIPKKEFEEFTPSVKGRVIEVKDTLGKTVFTESLGKFEISYKGKPKTVYQIGKGIAEQSEHGGLFGYTEILSHEIKPQKIGVGLDIFPKPISTLTKLKEESNIVGFKKSGISELSRIETKTGIVSAEKYRGEELLSPFGYKEGIIVTPKFKEIQAKPFGISDVIEINKLKKLNGSLDIKKSVALAKEEKEYQTLSFGKFKLIEDKKLGNIREGQKGIPESFETEIISTSEKPYQKIKQKGLKEKYEPSRVYTSLPSQVTTLKTRLTQIVKPSFRFSEIFSSAKRSFVSNVQKYKTESKPLIQPLSINKEDYILKFRTIEKQKSIEEQKLKSRQHEQPIQKIESTMTEKQKEIQKEIQPTIPPFEFSQPQKPRNIPSQPIVPKTAKSQKLTTKKEKIKEQQKESNISYIPQALLESTKPPRKRWINLSQKPLPRESALSSVARYIDVNISSQGRIKPVRQQPAQIYSDDYYEKNKFKFREYKIRKGVRIATTPTHIIEKRKYRLDYPSEVQQIQIPKIKLFKFI